MCIGFFIKKAINVIPTEFPFQQSKPFTEWKMEKLDTSDSLAS